MSQPVAWPKGPFPERYRSDAVWTRLESANPDQRVWETLKSRGLERSALPDDPYLFVFASTRSLEEIRRDLANLQAFAFHWSPGQLMAIDDSAAHFGVVASSDPVDAAVAVGVAGPAEGIGNPTLVRFLVHLRTFSTYDVTRMGEDRLELKIEAKSAELARRIADRTLQITPSLARSGMSSDRLTERIEREHRLEMFWRS